MDTVVNGYSAQPGYDLASGLGTLDAVRFIQAISPADPGNAASATDDWQVRTRERTSIPPERRVPNLTFALHGFFHRIGGAAHIW